MFYMLLTKRVTRSTLYIHTYTYAVALCWVSTYATKRPNRRIVKLHSIILLYILKNYISICLNTVQNVRIYFLADMKNAFIRFWQKRVTRSTLYIYIYAVGLYAECRPTPLNDRIVKLHSSILLYILKNYISMFKYSTKTWEIFYTNACIWSYQIISIWSTHMR